MASLELFSGFVTAPGVAAFSTVTPSSGTATVRDFKQGRCFMVDAWRNGQAVGDFRVTSPKLHDAVQGFRTRGIAAGTKIQAPYGFPQELYAQDTLTLQDTGSAAGGAIENVGILEYTEYPTSANAKLIGLNELETRMARVTPGQTLWAVEFALVGGVAGAFGAAQALSTGVADLSRANTDYALLGVTFSESAANNAAAFGVQGPDTGNFLVGIPALQQEMNYHLASYFLELTRLNKVDMIPVINAANKGGTFFSVLNNNNANTATASFIFATLG